MQKVKDNLKDNHIELDLNKLLNDTHVLYPSIKESIETPLNYFYIIIVSMFILFILNSVLCVVLFCHRKMPTCARMSSVAERQAPTIRVEHGTPLAEIIQESSFVQFNTPSPP
ncbi:hypothetical protein J6590_108386 [Homalodisca vitripennis]|nr:hypothetical protein J6590_108309 [Homalodisca vitripennis]KAG8332157.1 hypothetical protein J6590_108386 [Homalodisca vitripennis]